jgi:hypothetical protein
VTAAAALAGEIENLLFCRFAHGSLHLHPIERR